MAQELWKDSCALRGLQLARSDSSPAFDDFGKTSPWPIRCRRSRGHYGSYRGHCCTSVAAVFGSSSKAPAIKEPLALACAKTDLKSRRILQRCLATDHPTPSSAEERIQNRSDAGAKSRGGSRNRGDSKRTTVEPRAAFPKNKTPVMSYRTCCMEGRPLTDSRATAIVCFCGV